MAQRAQCSQDYCGIYGGGRGSKKNFYHDKNIVICIVQCFSQYSDSDVRKVYSEKLRGLSAAEIIAAFTKEEVQRKERRRKKCSKVDPKMR